MAGDPKLPLLLPLLCPLAVETWGRERCDTEFRGFRQQLLTSFKTSGFVIIFGQAHYSCASLPCSRDVRQREIWHRVKRGLSVTPKLFKKTSAFVSLDRLITTHSVPHLLETDRQRRDTERDKLTQVLKVFSCYSKSP